MALARAIRPVAMEFGRYIALEALMQGPYAPESE
jgi:hypothetical protein